MPNPNQFDYFQQGEPILALAGTLSSQEMDPFRQGEPATMLVIAAHSGSLAFTQAQAPAFGPNTASLTAAVTQAQNAVLARLVTHAISLTQPQSSVVMRSISIKFAMAQSQTFVIARTVNRIVTDVQVQSYTVAKSIGKFVLVGTQSSSVLLKRAVHLIFLPSQTQLLTLRRDVSNTLPYSQPQALTLAKRVSAFISIIQSQVMFLSDNVPQVLTFLFSQTTSLSLTKVVKSTRTTLTQGALVTVPLKNITKIIPTTQDTSSFLRRGIASTLSFTQGTVMTATKLTSKILRTLSQAQDALVSFFLIFAGRATSVHSLAQFSSLQTTLTAVAVSTDVLSFQSKTISNLSYQALGSDALALDAYTTDSLT